MQREISFVHSSQISSKRSTKMARTIVTAAALSRTIPNECVCGILSPLRVHVKALGVGGVHERTHTLAAELVRLRVLLGLHHKEYNGRENQKGNERSDDVQACITAAAVVVGC